ncbi:MAG: YkgJ family cysteine cluster protein [Firmicutes bacterium]|nr:YkgJ family cysteine cluster protein [Bacillota bacterium]
MDVKDMTNLHDLPAGGFSSWLRRTRSALARGDGMEVPCGGCSVCCRSSYFIHIRPEEGETLSRIDKKLLFPAPGLPRGNVLLGYFEEGSCPMLVDDRCSIYRHRPATCRGYDCRVFAAAGIEAGGEDKALITRQVQRWRFSYPTQRDRDRHEAVKAAAGFLREREECFPPGTVPKNEAQLAVMAVKVYRVFMKRAKTPERAGCRSTDTALAGAVMKALERFGAR